MEHERWWKGNGQRSRVTFLVARPAVGSLWPGRCNECRSAQGSCPEPFRRPREHSRSRVNKFRNWFRVEASGSIGPMCLKSGAVACAPAPSSAMSPAGYSLAVLSSNRLRFADRLQWWGSFRLRSTGKTSQPSAGGHCCRRQNRQKCGRFIPALTLQSARRCRRGWFRW